MKLQTINRLLLGGIACLLLGACGGNSQKKENTAVRTEPSAQVQQTPQPQFPFPEIPSMLTQPEERKAYLLKHYWDKFTFADTALVNNRDVTEQGFVNHIALLADGTTPDDLIEESVGNFCAGMETDAHACGVLMQMVDDYLYNPNSPYYNEKLYALYLRRMVDSPALDEARKSTFRFKLKLIDRNQPGTQATSFAYQLADGSRRTLQQTPVKGNRLLLVFYDPECPSCHDVLTEMMNDPALAEAVAAGKVSVLAVYTEGNEEAWRKALPDMPQGWMVATDHQTIKDGALYDLKAMPSLYLLDSNKKVLLKDVPYGTIKQVLMNN